MESSKLQAASAAARTGCMRAKVMLLVLVMAACACHPFNASAQSFPTKPVRVILGQTPDLLPRLVGQKLFESWGQQIVIDQHPGAGGIIAADTVAKAPPDGYTWLISAASYTTLAGLYSKLPYDFERDLAPVALMAIVPYILVVHPSVPAKSLAELVQLARRRPGELNYASSGTGAQVHLLSEMLKNSAHIDIVHVPYKSVVAGLTDLLGGQVQMMFAIAQVSSPHVLTGKLRALAITSTKRSVVVPDVPTMAQAGYPEFDGVVGWNGVHVPAKTPRAIVSKINADIARVLQLPDIKERMLASGFDPAQTTVEEFETFVKRDLQRYAKAIRDSHIRVE